MHHAETHYLPLRRPLPNHQACYLPAGDDDDEPYYPDCYLTVAGQKPIHTTTTTAHPPSSGGMGPSISAWSWRSTKPARTATMPRRPLAIANQGQSRLY